MPSSSSRQETSADLSKIAKGSPASGTPLRPEISAGCPGLTCFSIFPEASLRERTCRRRFFLAGKQILKQSKLT